MGAEAGARDAAPVVGRERELMRCGRVLAAGDAVRILFVHGPGGIGKTTLTRELARLARREERPVFSVDAREVPPSPQALSEALELATGADRPLVLIDSFELIESSAAYVRDALIPELPSGSALCIAGRNPPARGWFEGSFAESIEEIRLRPLSEDAARALLLEQGVDPGTADRIAKWSQGNPLALRLASRLAREGWDWQADQDSPPEELVRALIRRLGETDVGAGHIPTLGVAAIARSTTPGLLAAALPDHDASAEWEWLASRGFVEPVGEGVALHALLRDAVRSDLRRRDPLLARSLKRRIADHLYAMAESTGELNRVVDLSYLIEDPAMRWGFMWESTASYYLDSPRPGDADEIDQIFDRGDVTPIGGGEAAWKATRDYFARMPELGLVAKDVDGRIVGFTFVPTTAVDAPELERMPLVGPCLRHARTHEPEGEAVVMPYMCDLTGDPASGMIGMLSNAAILRTTRSNPRYAYMTIDREIDLGRAFAEAVGAARVPEADTRIGDTWADGWLIDFGPGGFLANQRELVYRELELEPPPRPKAPDRSVHAERVRDALRHIGEPTELAGSPLAIGEGVEERAESVRRLLVDAIESAFGEKPTERLLREVLVHGYLRPATSHEAAAAEVHLSRSAYFRRLKQAVERLSEYLAATAGDREAGGA